MNIFDWQKPYIEYRIPSNREYTRITAEYRLSQNNCKKKDNADENDKFCFKLTQTKELNIYCQEKPAEDWGLT